MENNSSLKKLKIELLHDTEISFWHKKPKKLKQIDTISMFIIELFTIAKRQRQPKSVLMKERIKT